MADSTAIEWTDATWNPVTGCTKISAGCDHCYAERFAERFRGVKDHPFERGFDLTLRPKRLSQPMAWRRPRMIFVNSMSDLFHKAVPRAFVDAVFETMESADWHVFQVLTKRSSRMRVVCQRALRGPTCAGPYMDGGLGRGRHQAVESPAPWRYGCTGALSYRLEPLIGSMRTTRSRWHPLDHRGRREWSRAHGQCIQIGSVKSGAIAAWLMRVPFFFKQWGGPRPKSGGRLLDGEEWNEFPWQIVPDGILNRPLEQRSV